MFDNVIGLHALFMKVRAKYQTSKKSERYIDIILFDKNYKLWTFSFSVSGTKQLVSHNNFLPSPCENQAVWNVRVC